MHARSPLERSMEVREFMTRNVWKYCAARNLLVQNVMLLAFVAKTSSNRSTKAVSACVCKFTH